MSDTQKNREAIQAMKDADGAGMSADDQAELLEQAAIQAAMSPERIRDREGNDITYRDVNQIVELRKHIGRQSSPWRMIPFIPGGTG